MMKFGELKKLLEENNNFIITTHVNPDADAIGSEMAVYYILKKLNKSIRIINYSETPYFLQFLDKEKKIEQYEPSHHDKLFSEKGVIIVVDMNQLSRTVKMENVLKNSSMEKVCIDHHQNPEGFENLQIIDSEYTSTGEIIYDFITQTGIVEPDYDIAVQIYSAIVTDTGSFKYNRTSSKTFRIAAELLDLGVKPHLILDKIYDENNLSKNRLLGRALNSMNLSADNKICYMEITRKDLSETGASEAELDGFVNYCLSVQGVEIGILFFELAEGLKVSFRSKGEVNVSQLAGEFGGGGHINAAGLRIYNPDSNNYKLKILESAQKYTSK
ncbi:MAG: bifunctional oligoribonuclease/PAP phosphatase NrnA [Ignavibacteria bacterium]|nr:bifunctional oligoribonuclease/PAP phosphatase NrnA [Ignavibacteria bacterium]